MFATEHHAKVQQMLGRGMTTSEILGAFSSQSDRLEVAAVLSAQPDPMQVSRYRVGNRCLITFCALMALLGVANLAFAYDEGKNWTPWAVSTAGHLGLAYGFVRRRLWAYAGFPVWLLWMLLNDLGILRSPAQDMEAASGELLALFYAVSIPFVWIAYRIRRRVYPYAGLIGPRKVKGGQLAIIAELHEGGPSRAV